MPTYNFSSLPSLATFLPTGERTLFPYKPSPQPNSIFPQISDNRLEMGRPSSFPKALIKLPSLSERVVPQHPAHTDSAKENSRFLMTSTSPLPRSKPSSTASRKLTLRPSNPGRRAYRSNRILHGIAELPLTETAALLVVSFPLHRKDSLDRHFASEFATSPLVTTTKPSVATA